MINPPEGMSTFKHTPGPWDAVDKRPDGFTGYSVFSGNQFVAYVGDSDRVTPVEANARLIAAAPELLEACQKLLPAYGEAHALYDLGDCEGSILARAAIAKATQEPQE
jgi:hypothetical protein